MQSTRRLILTLMLALFTGSLALATAAKADTMVWPVKSNYPYKVQVEFYSESRKWEWPGGGEAYALNDSKTHQFSLTCNSGEKICLGAWVTGNASKYWGVGLRRAHSCQNCCYVCGAGDIPRQVLD
jgi:hypothetical protein